MSTNVQGLLPEKQDQNYQQTKAKIAWKPRQKSPESQGQNCLKAKAKIT
jgi:hypothetical protein